MARCDQGYLCRVCGQEVEAITESELYLRYVIGEIDPEVLHLVTECHLACNPALSQFIDDPRAGRVEPSTSQFSAAQLDPTFVAERTALVTEGYRRLWDIRSHRDRFRDIRDYPLSPRR